MPSYDVLSYKGSVVLVMTDNLIVMSQHIDTIHEYMESL